MRVTAKSFAAVALVGALVMSRAPLAQAEQAGRGSAAETPLVSAKVTVVISRFDGYDKKTANLPFVLWVNTGRTGSALRMNSEVPVPNAVLKDGVSFESYSFREIGTNIDCSATDLGDGRYRLDLGVSDSQVFRMENVGKAALSRSQNFTINSQPILRDGQTVEYAVATDKTSGEVVKLQVTLNLVK